MADATVPRSDEPLLLPVGTGPRSQAESCILLLSAQGRVIAVGGDIRAVFNCPSVTLIGGSLEALVPPVYKTLGLGGLDRPQPDAASTPQPPPSLETCVSASDLVDTPNLVLQSLHVRLEALQTLHAAEPRWLLRLTVIEAAPGIGPLLPCGLAAALRADTYDRIAALLAHDLNNTLQALYGSLWLLEEAMAATPRSTSLLSALTSAVEQGVATVRLQSDLFRRRSPQLISVSKLVRELEPMLRKLLGAEHAAHFDLPQNASDCQVDRWLGQRILFVLFHFLGTHAKRALTVMLTGRLLDPSEGWASPLFDSGSLSTKTAFLQLRIDSDLVPEEGSQWPSQSPPFPHPLWAVEVLSREAGARFQVHAEPSGLAFDLRVPRPRGISSSEPASTSLS